MDDPSKLVKASEVFESGTKDRKAKGKITLRCHDELFKTARKDQNKEKVIPERVIHREIMSVC